MVVQDTKDCIGSRVLISVGNSYRGAVPTQSARENEFMPAPDTSLYEDNTTCIDLGNHVIGGRLLAKHIDISDHFVHESIQNRKMRLVMVDILNWLADIFTKSAC